MRFVCPTLLLLLVTGLLGCATAEHPAQFSGFLWDYSGLEKGGPGRAEYLYYNPKADFAPYKSVMIDPVTIWISPERQTQSMSEESLLYLANALQQRVTEQLKQDYQIVNLPQAGALRIRMALTEAKGGLIVLETEPSAEMGEKKAEVNPDEASMQFVSQAAIEIEILDADTGVRLAAGVDSRQIRQKAKEAQDPHEGILQAFDHWANRLRLGLKDAREHKKLTAKP